ncbi:hypothetical protein HHK36_002694 [Tetracentron sinense]|uniref:Uncharacterized protein n=1 Tax=Tetracentron sinense TaxID=13715 RepID=A0A834ZPW8_TETSI|nr:hypothetical protein HHK36_002694 [Tetracentron sinense]
MKIVTRQPFFGPCSFCRETKQREHSVSNLARVCCREKWRGSEKRVHQSYWVPDPRTGIYVPKGHEWMMDDVPETAASCNQTYWLRSIEGVDKPSPDASIDLHFHNNP